MSRITRDEDGNVDQDCIDLSPEKVFNAVCTQQTVLGKPRRYWASLIADHAQGLSDEATPEQYDEWRIEDLADV